LTQVILGEHENFEAGLKRFGRKVTEAGILGEAKRRRSFLSKGQRQRLEHKHVVHQRMLKQKKAEDRTQHLRRRV
jgi:ribosomal protein S21